jgi:hypothetical protein
VAFGINGWTAMADLRKNFLPSPPRTRKRSSASPALAGEAGVIGDDGNTVII